MATLKKATASATSRKVSEVCVEYAGVIVVLPSGHKETITTDQADDLYTSLDDLLNGCGGL